MMRQSLRLCSVLKRWEHSGHDSRLASVCLTKVLNLWLLHLKRIDTQPSWRPAMLSPPWQAVLSTGCIWIQAGCGELAFWDTQSLLKVSRYWFEWITHDGERKPWGGKEQMHKTFVSFICHTKHTGSQYMAVQKISYWVLWWLRMKVLWKVSST